MLKNMMILTFSIICLARLRSGEVGLSRHVSLALCFLTPLLCVLARNREETHRDPRTWISLFSRCIIHIVLLFPVVCDVDWTTTTPNQDLI